MNCSSDLKSFANSWPSTSNFASFCRSLEQFFLTVGQNNFGNKIPLFSRTVFRNFCPYIWLAAAPYLVRPTRPRSYLNFPEKSINWSFLLIRVHATRHGLHMLRFSKAVQINDRRCKKTFFKLELLPLK